MLRDIVLILCVVSTISAQDPKWSWSSRQREQGNSNDVERRRDSDRKFANLEDFRDRYEVAEQTTARPNSLKDDGYGLNKYNGQRFNLNAFGGVPPSGLGGPLGIGGPGIGGPFGGQFGGNGFGANGPYGGPASFGGSGPGYNGYRPIYQNGLGGQFPGQYQGGGYPGGYPGIGGYPGNGGYPGSGGYPGGGGGFYPGGGFSPVNNPYGNNAANGVLVGPGGPTGVIGRPPYGGFNGSPLGIGGPGGFTGGSYGPGVGGAYGPGGLPYSGKSGAGILADEPEENDKKKST